MQAANLTGTFGNVANGQRVATIDDLGSFQVHYGVGSTFNPNQIVINNFVANPLPGDFNDDGVVDAADYVVWRKFDLGTGRLQHLASILRAHGGRRIGQWCGDYSP